MHKILPVSNERWAGRSKIKNAANRRKTACSGAFGVPDTTRTCDPGLRRLVLYPTELLGHISKIFNFPAQTDSNELPLRRRPLYPTELRGLIQKIFNFAGLQDSNDSIFRRRSLYPAELPGHRSHTFRGTARAFSLVIAAVYCIPFCRRCQRKKGARLMPCSFSICRMRITSRRTWPSASAGADSDPWRPPRCA